MEPVPVNCVVEGRAFIGEDLLLRDVAITVGEGRILSIEETTPRDGPWICPTFFNAHTHLADTIALDVPASGDLAALVAPPAGLKHRLLAAAAPAEVREAMRSSILSMIASATTGFADFREGGADGVSLLAGAAEGQACHAVIFGRDGGERVADGVGVPSYRPDSGIEAAVACAREQGKLVAFHAGEKDADDIEGALSFGPDLLVHCTHATDTHLRRIADEGIPVAVCPRSNWSLGVAASRSHPPIERMLDLGCRVLLGTDNVMFVQPDMFQEMAFTAIIYRIPPADILRMAIAGSALFTTPQYISEGNPAAFFTIDPMRGNLRYSRDPLTTVVKRMSPALVGRIIYSMR
ncbi:MAG: amidohydrolase family protein [Methanomicrobiaceae archaeon]|nr:amidohydrolase family protein [Methanomicrobiaceae archaeon]